MKKRLGQIYWANSRKIDKFDQKERRQYAVSKDNGLYIKVVKVRGYNENLKNNDRLFELDTEKYGLKKRSGIDYKEYSFRSDNRKLLNLEDREVFDNYPSIRLSSHDTHKMLSHIKLHKKGRRLNSSPKVHGAGRNKPTNIKK